MCDVMSHFVIYLIGCPGVSQMCSVFFSENKFVTTVMGGGEKDK
jgi:hypothetical protein